MIMRSIPPAVVKEAVEMTTEYKAYEPTNTDTAEDELRRRAVKRLGRRRVSGRTLPFT